MNNNIFSEYILYTGENKEEIRQFSKNYGYETSFNEHFDDVKMYKDRFFITEFKSNTVLIKSPNGIFALHTEHFEWLCSLMAPKSEPTQQPTCANCVHLGESASGYPCCTNFEVNINRGLKGLGVIENPQTDFCSNHQTEESEQKETKQEYLHLCSGEFRDGKNPNKPFLIMVLARDNDFVRLKLAHNFGTMFFGYPWREPPPEPHIYDLKITKAL